MTDSAESAIAALEFGTSYCGYAFAKEAALTKDPLKIHTMSKPTQPDKNPVSMKRMSSCILLNNKNTYIDFGYEAERKYAEDSKSNFFFRDLISLLNQTCKNKIFKIKEEPMLVDVTGQRSVSARKLIVPLIQCLQELCSDEMKKENIQCKVRWVITVPADLNDTCEFYIRFYALSAGISSDHLMMISEADAAFAHCHTLLENDRSTKLQDSTEYMIVNLRGSTADIRIVKKVNDLLIEKFPLRNNGSSPSVTSEFMKLLEKFFDGAGKNTSLEESLKTNPLAFLAIERELEAAKYFSTNEKVVRNIAVPLTDICTILGEDDKGDYLDSLLKNNGFEDKITLKESSMSFKDTNTYWEIFKPFTTMVIQKMERVFKDCKEANRIPFIILAGDFYDCCLLKPWLRNKFPQKRIIFSKKREEAVMKGTVLYGHKPYHYTLESLQAYEKKANQKGLLLVINFSFEETRNEPKSSYREASDEDVLKLKSFFESRNYEVISWGDKTSNELKTDLETFKNTYLRQECDKYHCFFCVIMSHGDENEISTTDGHITVDDLVKPFRNDTATEFMGKPKIFMIQTCRGGDIQVKVTPDVSTKHDNQASDFTRDEERLPTDADIIKIFSTIKGNKSFRNILYAKWKGAWLIQAFLCTAKQYPKKHLLEILTAVNYELARNPEYEFGRKFCQLSVSEPALSKLFYIGNVE